MVSSNIRSDGTGKIIMRVSRFAMQRGNSVCWVPELRPDMNMTGLRSRIFFVR